MNKLRVLGVTPVHTLKVPDIIGRTIRVPLGDRLSPVESLVPMRSIELRSCLNRLIPVLTVWDGDFAPLLYEFVTSSNGLRIEETCDYTEVIMAGVLRRKDNVTSPGQTAPAGRDD